MIDVNMSMLIDVYGGLLTEKQRLSMELYYNEDYSLSEIADHLGISRQGVHENITRGTEKIQRLESVLCVKKKSAEIKRLVFEAKKELSEQSTEKITALLEEMEDVF